MSEENREQARRRRRAENAEEGALPAIKNETEEPVYPGQGAGPARIPDPAADGDPADLPGWAGAETIRTEKTTEALEKEPEKAEPAEEAENMPAQAPDARVPAQARQMNASPYGAGNQAAPRRPGTRPAVAVRRLPIREPEKDPDEAEEAAASLRPNPHLQVGYAPGRMSERGPEEPAEPQATARIGEMVPNRVRMAARPGMPAGTRPADSRAAGGRPADPRPAGSRNMSGRPMTAMTLGDKAPREKKRHPLLWTAAVLVLAAVIAVAAVPQLRNMATGLIGKVFGTSASEPKPLDAKAITRFSAAGNEGQTAPADVVLTVRADKSIRDLRIASSEGGPYTQETGLIENDDTNVWTLTMYVTGGFNDIVRLEATTDGDNWQETEYAVVVNVTAPASAAEETPIPPAETAAPAEPAGDGEPADSGEPDEDGEPADSGEPAGDPEPAEDAEPWDGPEEDGGDEAEPWEPGGEAEPADADETADEEMTGDEARAAADAADGEPAEAGNPAEEAEPTPAPTPEPLTAEAAPGANPNIFQVQTVYEGSKKVKNYMRSAKELIHMPSGWDYPFTKMGVLTFRGNAFRTNAAVGNVATAAGLKELWRREAGSARGASVTYYGYEYPSQPAIVKWSKQVRQASNIDVDKQNVSALREVIIAGVDGVIRFYDLEDGQETRASINLGYPMKGTPSIHPGTYPYMTVGQYARKMKVRTGKIGLRQYNLYTQKEMSLIDGLDGKLHRGLNRVGSFETSALIDRNSDTLITAGSNGLLYLISLNSEFDWKAGSYKTSASTVVYASRTKAQKKNIGQVAVESSVAMYDRYVYYADMGGVLRCVDTNFLTPVWAVETGDAVMAAVALDLVGTDRLDLYTANMLKNRKKGAAQVRRYDALTGKEIWTVEVGVQKDTKNKTDSGFKASPVIGENALQDLVYFTVTGLNDDGRNKLDVAEGTQAALIALNKETGKIEWSRALSDRSESSPVAVYDEEGNGWIIQAAWDGSLVMLDGLTGAEVAKTQLEGNISASPAVYNEILVIGTTGKGTEYVYGILIR